MCLHGPIVKGVGTASTIAMQIREARKNRKFQKKMYRHRYQYTAEDMKKAGINPILAAQSGLGGGGSPSGSMAQLPDLGGIGDTAVTAEKTSKQKELMDEQIKSVEATTAKTKAETDIIDPKASIYERFNENIVVPLLDKLEEVFGGQTAKSKGNRRMMELNNLSKPWSKQDEVKYRQLMDRINRRTQDASDVNDELRRRKKR